MTLAEILGSNPQEFIMEAYSDPLKYYAPDPPNTTDPAQAIQKIVDVSQCCLGGQNIQEYMVPTDNAINISLQNQMRKNPPELYA